jgi:hypothetical protein
MSISLFEAEEKQFGASYMFICFHLFYIEIIT